MISDRTLPIDPGSGSGSTDAGSHAGAPHAGSRAGPAAAGSAPAAGSPTGDTQLTSEQRAIVEAGDGPLVVIAGAGTGKTRVIVERVRWLLETKGDVAAIDGNALLAGEPRATAPEAGRLDNPFEGPLSPEQILVLTYNVKAAKELQRRIDAAVGPATRARMTVSNFHSFCHRVLTESPGEAGVAPNPDVLDGVSQVLLLRDIRGELPLLYHSEWNFGAIVSFINRAKDELVTPDHFDAFVANEREAYELRFGSYEEAAVRLNAQGNLRPLKSVRGAYAAVRTGERARARGEEPAGWDERALEKAADREARRTIAGDGRARPRHQFHLDDHPRIDELAESYVADGAALEVMRLTELALVYRAYQAELVRRGALDFGEQIAAVTQLFKVRPNLLRRWQRQYRYILVDEFQDANVAQIELVEMLGRTPDRQDNVMVVGDDDQSIYRFRGASYAAFAEFDAKFSRPAAHDRRATPPGPPRRLRLDENFRSVERVIRAANRVIDRNQARFEPGKRLVTARPAGEPVRLIVCAGPEDEAVAIVDAIKALAAPGEFTEPAVRAGSAVEEGTRATTRPKPRWSDIAILYRKHRHREAIVARLREEDIPYTVVGGLSLFGTPEIRDLEQALRAIADPHNDVALVRMLSAGPWRMDALETLEVSRMARFDRRHLVDVVREIVASGVVRVDRLDNGDAADRASKTEQAVDPATRAKLRRLIDALEELTPLTWREGPFTILERYVERTGQVLDLIAADSLEAKRTVANIASFLRFAADWQGANPHGTLAGFVDYLDAYQQSGGELPTSVELTEDVEGVRLMTLYQAKGLEFRHVIVPCLVDGEWPVREGWSGYFPAELLREQVPAGDIHTEEERRLLYVAMTRARDTLILTTHDGPAVDKGPSAFVGEVSDGAADDLLVVDRTGDIAAAALAADDASDAGDDDLGPDGAAAATLVRRVIPLPTRRERRLELRLRAAELIGLLEGTAPDDPEAPAARDRFASDLVAIGRSAAIEADQARALGLDPLTFRTIALDTAAGANLLDVAPLPGHFSYSSLSAHEACPLRYAFSYVYGIPTAKKVGALTFGSTAHAAFEAFTRERRERAARGEPEPTREDLARLFAAEWTPTAFPDRTTEDGFRRRIAGLLDNFYDGELASTSQVLHEELDFELVIDPGDGTAPVRINGGIDRIDRLPSGGIEVIDYKTGRISSQKDVDQNLQLSIYALACRDTLGLGTPERVTLYFTESATRLSTTRTDGQLDAARADILSRVGRIRSGDFAATPSPRTCEWCDYRAMCPERV
jgi:DNA helicase II / ATP-dependent DNA helicase PcrA